MKKRIFIISLCLTACIYLAGCSDVKEINDTALLTEETAAVTEVSETEEPAETAEEKAETAALQDRVASAEDMAAPAELDDEGLEVFTADDIADGTYEITVDSSSSMFNITSCTLTVEDGKMNAVMTMSGKGYLYVFMGTGEEAVNADSAEYISFVENENGEHTFTVPVEALNKAADCTAFSKKKEKWYDRKILFRADSLPLSAFSDSAFATAESLGLSDGIYTADVKLEGGSGRASVSSPAEIRIENGKASAVIEWSSSNYDYMTVGDEKYFPVNEEGNSVFEIPVSAFDIAVPVKADTTAMSTPHEIEYTLFFSSDSITEK